VEGSEEELEAEEDEDAGEVVEDIGGTDGDAATAPTGIDADDDDEDEDDEDEDDEDEDDEDDDDDDDAADDDESPASCFLTTAPS